MTKKPLPFIRSSIKYREYSYFETRVSVVWVTFAVRLSTWRRWHRTTSA